MRWTQVKKLATVEAFRSYCDELGIEIPISDEVAADGPLAQPLEITDAATTLRVPNRFAVLPMEGWDGSLDGKPTDLVTRRWSRFAASGCGLVWGEATAVRVDGRANPNQLVINEHNLDEIAQLRAVLADDQVTGLQLTHSGRWSRPDGDRHPRTAYEHPILDRWLGIGKAEVFSDDELDELAADYVAAAVLAREAGFDFVDVKHCHGYLLHELLSAYERPGRYGGDFAGRTRFLRTVVDGIRANAPGLAIAVRLSAFDLVPFVAGDDGVGRPDAADGLSYGCAFGGDRTGLGIDLTETHAFLDLLVELGIGLVAITAGSPYYNPHIQRPAFFPPSDGYKPPEDPLVGVARQLGVVRDLIAAHPELAFIGAGYSYLQDWLPNVADAVVGAGQVSMVGLGRMILSYPSMAADVLAGRDLDKRLICRTFSDCTTGPRNGLVSGCFPLDHFYRDHPQRVELAKVKKQMRSRGR